MHRRSHYHVYMYFVIAVQCDFLLYCRSGISNVCFALNCQYLYLVVADASISVIGVSPCHGFTASITPDIHRVTVVSMLWLC